MARQVADEGAEAGEAEAEASDQQGPQDHGPRS